LLWRSGIESSAISSRGAGALRRSFSIASTSPKPASQFDQIEQHAIPDRFALVNARKTRSSPSARLNGDDALHRLAAPKMIEHTYRLLPANPNRTCPAGSGPFAYFPGPIAARCLRATDRAIRCPILSRPSNRGLRSGEDKIINSEVRKGGVVKKAADTIEHPTAVCS
jgi:hypothetical protein